MLRRSVTIGVVTVGMLLCLRGALPADRDSATIVNSGSTNRPGFRIVVDRSGTAEFTSVPRRPAAETKPVELALPQGLAERFYAALKAAKPLSSLPELHCVKSASFGFVLTVSFDGEETPDLSCGSNSPVMDDLIRDANEIIALFREKG